MSNFQTAGYGLDRPESVIALKDGRVYASDRKRGVVRVLPEPSLNGELSFPHPDFVPNGIALLPDGSFLIANLGSQGGIWRLTQPNELIAHYDANKYVAKGPTGFSFPDDKGRLWIALTTKTNPRESAYRRHVSDGAIAMINAEGHLKVCAQNLGFVNEVRVHPDGRWLYATETFARRLSRFEISRSGELSTGQIVCEFGAGVWPDGFEFDTAGNVWVTSVVSNRLICVRPDGSNEMVISDCDAELLMAAEANFQADRFGAADLAVGKTGGLGNVSSIAFAGPARRTMYLGNLSNTHLVQWQSPVAGIEPLHWSVGNTVLE